MTERSYCLNFSSSSTEKDYYVYMIAQLKKIQDMLFKSNENGNKKKVSLNFASSVCHSNFFPF